jgi:hypothetical protein
MRKRYDDGGEVLEAANPSADAQDIAKSMGAGPKNEEAPKASKPRVVSKKELEASGYDNLRDYLNAQRGLTRRKDKTDPTAGEARDKAAQEAADAIDPGRETRGARYTPPYSAPKQTTQKVSPKVFMPQRPDNSFPGAKFKSGGSVSSASKRGDGIAQRGKTRGIMVMCGGGMSKGKK